MISLPFQNNTNFDIGHTDNTQNVLNIQPVYPIHLNPDWNLITRPILPVISQPPFLSGPELHAAEQVFGPEIGETEFGLGDLTPEFFFSPRKPIQLGPEASLVWGLGPAFQFPTATDDELGSGKWSAGPGFVVFLSDRALHVTTGFLILNLWSFAGDEDRADVNAMTLQPFLNYNLPKGWYWTASPLITAKRSVPTHGFRLSHLQMTQGRRSCRRPLIPWVVTTAMIRSSRWRSSFERIGLDAGRFFKQPNMSANDPKATYALFFDSLGRSPSCCGSPSRKDSLSAQERTDCQLLYPQDGGLWSP